MDFTEGIYELIFGEASRWNRQLQISAVGYEPVTSEEFKIDEGQRVIDFKLTRASDFDEKTAGHPRQEDGTPEAPRITGIVRDEKGAPVSDAVVCTYPSLGEETVTNAEGEFSLKTRRISGAGTMSSRSINREEVTYILVRQKEQNLAAAIQLDDMKDKLEIKLSPGVIFSGKVVDVNDKGITDAEIALYFHISRSAHGTRESADIDSDGSFEIRAIPHGFRYSVYASADGYGRRYVEANTSEAVSGRMELEQLVLNLANLSASGIVVDELGQPVSNIRIYAYGNGQPSRETYTNTKGKFTLENMCRGPIHIQANSSGSEGLHGRATVEGGAMGIKIVARKLSSSGRSVPIKLPSLVGKSLPDLKSLGIKLHQVDTTEKMILVCFIDMEQRPSRNCIMQLSKRAQELKAKDIVIIAVQVSKIKQEELEKWIKGQNISLPVGMIEKEEEKTRFTWGIKSLPWMILTDKNHVVVSEGFSVSELDAKIGG
jgi:hypothetical protein